MSSENDDEHRRLRAEARLERDDDIQDVRKLRLVLHRSQYIFFMNRDDGIISSPEKKKRIDAALDSHCLLDARLKDKRLS